MSKSESKHVKKLDGTLLSGSRRRDAARRGATTSVKAVSSDQLRGRPEAQLTYARSAIACVVTRYEDNEKTDGLGSIRLAHLGNGATGVNDERDRSLEQTPAACARSSKDEARRTLVQAVAGCVLATENSFTCATSTLKDTRFESPGC